MDRHQHSFGELLAVVRRLPAITPQAAKLPVNGYETFQEQWIGWLEEYDGPGYYGRADGKRDARWVYQHLNNGKMIVWLNEAAGESHSTIEAASRTWSCGRRCRPRPRSRALTCHGNVP